MQFTFLIFVVVLVIIISVAHGAKTKKSKSDGDVEEVKFSSEKELNAKIKDIKDKKAELGYDDTPTPEELAKFQEAEKGLRKAVERATMEHGAISREVAKALHALGGNMFRQLRFEELFEISMQIVNIHETLDGFEATMTGKALGNTGTVAYRLGLTRECEIAMKRALYILLNTDKLAEDSRDVLMHRGKMLSFHIADGETTKGMSYAEYTNLMEDEL